MSYSECSCGLLIHLRKSSNALRGHIKKNPDHHEVKRFTYLPTNMNKGVQA